MSTIYIGHQWRTESRLYLLDVVANSLEEAKEKFANGEGRTYASVEEIEQDRDEVVNIHEDLNDGMGR